MNAQTEVELGTALALQDATKLAAVFAQKGGVDAIIERIEAEARSHVPDLTTAKGRDAIKSLAHKVARSKTTLDEAGKSLNEERRAAINAVDAERRKLRERLDALKEEVRKPLDEWEAREEARVAGLKARLAAITDGGLTMLSASAGIAAHLDVLRAVTLGPDWEEYLSQAEARRADAIARTEATLLAAQKREADEAELNRLREEAAARAEADRLRAEAEARQRAAKEAAERAEADRIAAEKAEAERAARIEREKHEAAERAARAAEERAAREAAEAEARHARELAEAKAREEAAAQRERDRLAAERKAEEDARAKREKDKAHRAKIRAEIADGMKAIGSKDWAALADAIIDGKVPHVRAML